MSKHKSWRSVLVLLMMVTGMATIHGNGPRSSRLPLMAPFSAIAQFISQHNPVLTHRGARAKFRRVEERQEAWLQQAPLNISSLWGAASTLAHAVQDPHTVVFPSDSMGVVPVQFVWFSDNKLLVFPLSKVPGLSSGDSVWALGRQTPGHLLRRLHTVISGNPYWVESMAGPYLSMGMVLTWLGVVHHHAVRIVLETPSHHRRSIVVPLYSASTQWTNARNRLDVAWANAVQAPPGITVTANSAEFFAWAVHPAHNYGVFWLWQCRDTAAYRAAVNAFFQRVMRDHITRVVWDLQDNEGGTATVIMPWLRWMRTSSILQGYNHTPWVVTSTVPLSERFAGRTYVLVNGTTFSAAVMDADLLSANHLATLVGQPTGLGPSGYGNVLVKIFDGLTVQTSTETFVAPHGSWAPWLTPRILIPLTPEDLSDHHNPVAQWLDAGLPTK